MRLANKTSSVRPKIGCATTSRGRTEHDHARKDDRRGSSSQAPSVRLAGLLEASDSRQDVARTERALRNKARIPHRSFRHTQVDVTEVVVGRLSADAELPRPGLTGCVDARLNAQHDWAHQIVHPGKRQAPGVLDLRGTFGQFIDPLWVEQLLQNAPFGRDALSGCAEIWTSRPGGGVPACAGTCHRNVSEDRSPTSCRARPCHSAEVSGGAGANRVSCSHDDGLLRLLQRCRG